MLHLSKSDDNTFRSTKYASKLVKNFLDKPLEKKMLLKSFAYQNIKTLQVKFFNTPIPLSTDVESLFLLGLKTFFAQKVTAMLIFKSLYYFLKEIHICLFTNLVACIICFEYWLRTVAYRNLSSRSIKIILFEMSHLRLRLRLRLRRNYFFGLAETLAAQDFQSNCACAYHLRCPLLIKSLYNVHIPTNW